MAEIIISDEHNFRILKEKIIAEGASNLHILADFDKTLTTAFVDGKKFQSAIAVLRDGNYLSEEYGKLAHAMFEKYHPFENDQTIPDEERARIMHQWWKEHFELLINVGLSMNEIRGVVDSGKIKLRDGIAEMFALLREKHIPIIIMSATGLGECIPLTLEKHGLMSENVFIVANSFTWDKDGRAIKVNEPIIHSANKDETAVEHLTAHESIKNRKNILLLGDSIEDVKMSHGFNADNVLKIGFLNDKVEERLEKYKKAFDVVVTEDGSLDFVNKLLKSVTQDV